MKDFIEFEEIIDKFRGKYGYLSNFHECHLHNDFTGKSYRSSEHYFVAHKASNDKDHEMLREHPFDGLKRAGQNIKLRDDWEEVKETIMMEALLEKFTRNHNLWDKLVATGDTPIVEGNTWHDNFYGDCICPKCEKIEGQNKLGQMLMDLRSYLRGLDERN